ncbi:MAG: lysylphosphatidylglycerol synthase domain-containing protein [Nitrososphaerota archaeon]
MRYSIVGIIIALSVTILIINVFNISLEDVLDIQSHVLILALALNFARFMAQGLRLHMLLRRFSCLNIGYIDSFALRGASEFFALTIIPFMADEAARTWLLTERGERATVAFWISIVELMLDTLVGSTLAFAAGLNALVARAYYLATMILVISTTQMLAAVVFISLAKGLGGNALKAWITKRSDKMPLPLEIRRRLSEGSNEMTRILCATFSRTNLSLLTQLILLTIVIMITPALILYLMLNHAGILGTLLGFHAGSILGTLPITVGGAGLTETGLYLYLHDVLSINSPLMVMHWRIATYYISLIVSGMLLIMTFFQVRLSTRFST